MPVAAAETATLTATLKESFEQKHPSCMGHLPLSRLPRLIRTLVAKERPVSLVVALFPKPADEELSAKDVASGIQSAFALFVFSHLPPPPPVAVSDQDLKYFLNDHPLVRREVLLVLGQGAPANWEKVATRLSATFPIIKGDWIANIKNHGTTDAARSENFLTDLEQVLGVTVTAFVDALEAEGLQRLAANIRSTA